MHIKKSEKNKFFFTHGLYPKFWTAPIGLSRYLGIKLIKLLFSWVFNVFWLILYKDTTRKLVEWKKSSEWEVWINKERDQLDFDCLGVNRG